MKTNSQPKLSQIKDNLLNTIYPTRCVCCESFGQLLCDKCKTKLLAIDDNTCCATCGTPFGKYLCTTCNTPEGRFDSPIDLARSCFEYTPEIAELVLAYKNHGETRLYADFAQLLAGRIAADCSDWLEFSPYIVPVPSDFKSVNQRGFDHINKICQELPRHIPVHVLPLLSKKAVALQKSLNRVEREANMADALVLNHSTLRAINYAVPQRVILIDDIVTTGATMRAAAQVLKDAGVIDVRALSIAFNW